MKCVNSERCSASRLATATALSCAGILHGITGYAQVSESDAAENLEEVVVTAKSRVFGNNVVSDPMKAQQTPITSVNAVIDNLPGVSIQEGDTFGFDDWSTTIAVRGFQVSLDEQQVGTTIDGMPNGNSNYGGGAKANRYIDTANLAGVEVSQGTSDIASRSHEALGGTLNFLTADPLQESRVRAQLALGEFDAQRFYVRYDTGNFAGENRAWISVSHQNASDWVNGIAENKRDNFAAKLASSFTNADVSAYISFDDTHEDNYQRLFSPDEFESNKEWDRLTNTWSGIPYIDQVYRPGWSTLRENLFGYVKADIQTSDSLTLSGSIYYHDNKGRGDWIPPYLLDVVDDAGGPESEVLGGTNVQGGASLGRIYFVNGAGLRQEATAGCISSITFPYGGAGPEYDPACQPPGSIAVQSYRHTHYEKTRLGANGDFRWEADLRDVENVLRGGFWYEDATREEYRDWHKILDTRVGIDFDTTAYYTQYSRRYPQDTVKWYVEDTVDFGDVQIALGAKQFMVNVERNDLFAASPNVSIDSDSGLLFSGGVIWQMPLDGFELFAGYSENFKAISDLVLERPDSDLALIEPETAENLELGMRYQGEFFNVTATYYDIDFRNRIIFLGPQDTAGPNYDIGTNGTYFNAGGIESSGIEIAADIAISDQFSLYASYSYDDSVYLGSGDPAVDTAQGVTAGNAIVGIPESQFVASLDWAGDYLHAGISTKFTGNRFVNFANTWVAEEYFLTDAYIGLVNEQFSGIQGLNINLVVNNLFDEDYLGGISGQGAWIGAPRTFAIAATLDF